MVVQKVVEIRLRNMISASSYKKYTEMNKKMFVDK